LRLLLDTHALIWTLSAPAKLPRFVSDAIDDPANFVFASVVSAWEMAIKQSLGRLDFPLGRLGDTLIKTGIVDLPITLQHAVAVSRLPAHHRDPFDRLLIAQAQLEGLTLVSRDPLVRQYQVAVLWPT
jgi:PIN domain nuclease of toxin-antitoxin system